MSSLFQDIIEEDLKWLAVDIYRGKVFTDRHIPYETEEEHARSISVVFMPIGLGCMAHCPKEEIENIGIVYEYLSKASSRTVNKMPMFFSVNFLTKEQTQIVFDFLTRFRNDDNQTQKANEG